MTVIPVRSESTPLGAPEDPSTEAGPLIEALRAEAAKLLGSAVGTSPLVSLQIGAPGQLPYYYTNPRNLEFNAQTYEWINHHLAAKTLPVKQDALFTTLYTQALTTVGFSLSTADQAKLNQANRDATDQQLALLQSWKSAFGSIPPATPTQQPIDIIMDTIATTWAAPPTTLIDIQQAPNLFQLLNRTPASGKPVVPVLANYLNALGSSISLQNATTMNNGYLERAKAAVQTPSIANGGLLTDDTKIRPRYDVATPLNDVINGLKATSNAITVGMNVSRSSESQYTVSLSGGSRFSIRLGFFFTLSVNANASYFSDTIATESNTVEMSMTFPGVTLMNFGPAAFDSSILKSNWYWMFPITQAIANGSADVTGFKFSPDPRIDFGRSGPFGFLEGAAISNYPSVKLVIKSEQWESIAKTITSSTSTRLSFLGIPLAAGSASNYSHTVDTKGNEKTVTIVLNPPLELVAGQAVDSRGWVLGVQTDYPAANV